VPEQFKLDLQLEKDALVLLNDGVKLCRDLGDNGTEALLKDILVSEEEHADWLETQLALIGPDRRAELPRPADEEGLSQ
jgi:bacterioferritin